MVESLLETSTIVFSFADSFNDFRMLQKCILSCYIRRVDGFFLIYFLSVQRDLCICRLAVYILKRKRIFSVRIFHFDRQRSVAAVCNDHLDRKCRRNTCHSAGRVVFRHRIVICVDICRSLRLFVYGCDSCFHICH